MVGLRQPSLYAHSTRSTPSTTPCSNRATALFAATADLAVADDPREAVRDFVRVLLEFSNADLVRYHLLFQRPIPGFAPSEASYKVAIEFYERGAPDSLRPASPTRATSISSLPSSRAR
jgi:hypothetical protein